MSDWLRVKTARIAAAILVASMPAAGATRSPQNAQPSLAERIGQVVNRPEFKHATFGVEFYSLDQQKPVYSLNP
ncbi:MAG TPA: hypothetical protein VGZ29_02175, partial [Terriglobia bacterium]|nr:hypothetical protein [Terriglobia bacterium]